MTATCPSERVDGEYRVGVSATPTLVAAHRYARRGWSVFPCQPRGKVPATARGFHDATTDPSVIDRLWSTCPDANVAVATGAVSGVIVLDVDGDEGHDSLRALEREHGELPRTASVVTPRGGSHFLFSHPGVEVRCSAGRLGSGLDIRADHGYALLPPSVGANGRRYEPDERAPIAALPGWLERRLAEPRNPQARPVSEWRELAAHGAVEGRRNDAVARLCGHLLARDVDPFVALTLLISWNRACNTPPLGDEEVARTVDSIARREAAKWI